MYSTARLLIVSVIALMLTSAVSAQTCDVDIYSQRGDGSWGYDTTQTFLICPATCPVGSNASSFNGSYQCLITGISSQNNPVSNCGNGLPCGPVPWRLPSYPVIESPTPVLRYEEYGAVITATPSPTPTLTPTATATFDFGIQTISDTVATLSGMSALDVEIDGTPISFNSAIDNVSTNADMIFGYVKSIFGATWGPFTPLATLAFLIFGITLAMVAYSLFIPLISRIFGFIRRFISFILDFIPG